MREGQTQPVRREDYAPPAYWIRQVELTFDLDPAKTIVGSKMTIERNGTQPLQPLRLNGEGLNLLRVLADGDSVAFRHDDGDLVIELPAERDRVVLEIRNTCAPEANTELSGLYTSGGGFFTQCEAQGFRRITYFLDRPDVMAVYTVTLRADKARCPKLLCNGNLVGRRRAGRRPPLRHLARPAPQAVVPVCAGGRRPGLPRAARALARRPRPPAAGVRAPRRHGQDRTRDELADRVDRVGRGALRPHARPRALHGRGGRRLQHGRDGEQGVEPVQHQVRAGQRGHRHRRRLLRRRKRDRPRVLPQLDRQPHHLPRLVPAVAEGRPHGLSRPGVQHGHDGLAVGARHQAHPRRAVPARGAVRRGRRPDGAPGAPGVVHRDRQLLHQHRLRKRRRGRAHDAHAGRPRGFPARHGPVLPAPRRPGRHLRRLRAGHRRRQPGQLAGRAPRRVQALVRAGRHAGAAGARPPRRRVAHLHAAPGPALCAHAGPEREAAVRDSGVVVAAVARRPAAAAAAAGRADGRRHRRACWCCRT